jgi:hypothetical protein
MKTFLFLFIPLFIYPQQTLLEEELDSAFINAKKGIYWALSNIKPGKNIPGKELIADNKLYAVVKLTREIDGVKIESKGFHNSVEVSVKLYRSEDFLESEGYLKREVPPEKPVTKKRKL